MVNKLIDADGSKENDNGDQGTSFNYSSKQSKSNANINQSKHLKTAKNVRGLL